MFAEVNVLGYSGKEAKTFTYSYQNIDIVEGDLVKLKFANRASIGLIRNPKAIKPKKDFKLQNITEKLAVEPIPTHLLKLGDWLIDYYCASSASVWQLMIPKNPTTKPRKIFESKKIKLQKLTELTEAQSNTIRNIKASKKPVLLEGAMGSGKTEIYFHLIQELLKKDKSTVLMMPEIFLTKQMIERAQKHFGDKLIITHSSMTPAQRRAIWVQCNTISKKEGLVVLGPRSAMFAPLHNIGAIIIDEFHEQSYKQDSSPRYQTEIVAGKLASLTGSKLILGSATPSITARYLSGAGKLTRVHLSERALGSQHPNIKIVKIKGEILSPALHGKIQESLNGGKISLLYINRRGTAPVFKCVDCGQSFECPHCGVNLHFHADKMKLLCHVCGYQIQPPGRCPSCDSTALRGIGIGTKAVSEEIQKLFPKAKIARVDTDSAAMANFEKILEDISKGKIDIIIGTQMIGRGLDIAKLELVGIINADYDLLSIDYNSLERAFQLLTQTAGRAGRRNTQGTVIIQSSQDQNPIFDLIINNDFDSFYAQELEARKKYSYPPYSYLLKLECGFVSPDLGKQKAKNLIKKLQYKPIAILGPVQSHPAIRGKKHMWSLVIKSKDRKVLIDIAKNLDQYWTINLDPFGIS